LFASALTFFAAATSEAATIDFTDSAAWGAANGVNDAGFTSGATYDGVAVTVRTGSSTQFITFNSGDVHLLCGLTGLDCDGDGLGVGDDEITYGDIFTGAGERLWVEFSQPVNITGLGFLDLYRGSRFTDEPVDETAKWVAFGSGGPVEGQAQNPALLTGNLLTPGYQNVGVNLLGVTSMFFFTGPSLSLPTPGSNSDFALASIDMTPVEVPVPEPATLLLTGAGLAAALRARRRRA
jgi:hypothetical protein